MDSARVRHLIVGKKPHLAQRLQPEAVECTDVRFRGMKTSEFAEFTVGKIVPYYGTSIGALRARGGEVGRGEAVGNLSRR